MGLLRLIAAAIVSASLSACGGGGDGTGTGSGGASGSPPDTGSGSIVPVPVPVPTLTLSTGPLVADLAAGDEWSQKLEGAIVYTGDLPLYVQVRDAGGAFGLPPVQAAPADKRVALEVGLRTTLSAGSHVGSLEVRLCKDAACGQTFDGASASVAYAVRLAPVDGWSTHQRDAHHSGEVPIRLNPARFSKAWEWEAPAISGVSMGINPVVTKAGKVFVSTDVYFGEARLYALKEADGGVAWMQSLGTVPAFNPPAVGGTKVYAAVTGHGDTLWAFDLETGQFEHKSGFNGQWPHFLAPTVADDVVYQGSGYYGGEVMAVSTLDGSRKWMASLNGGWDMFTPAVSESHVFHHTGRELVTLDKATGAVLARIADPFGSGSGGYSYHGAPMVGRRNNVISFSGLAFSGLASAAAEQYEQRKLSSFDIAGNKYEWSTAATYLTAPALGNGVLYAARNAPMGLDAIDEATGKVLWTWTAPGPSDTEFHRNVVLTRTHLFVSTNSNVYAVDLATKRSVWSYPAPGMLALSADRTLYIATGARRSDGGLVAIRLR